MTRQVDERAQGLVKRFEGVRTQAYRCPAGVWTIGYGHTERVTPRMKVCEAEAEALLAEDLAQVAARIEPLLKVDVNDAQFGALVSFAFNAGVGALAGSTLLRRLNRGEYQAVPSEMARWVMARDPQTGKQRALHGLVERRAAEGALWLAGDPDEDMPQRVDSDRARPAFRVTARRGLRLRELPGTHADVVDTLAYGQLVYLGRLQEGWAEIDVEGDGAVDGWAAASYLAPAED